MPADRVPSAVDVAVIGGGPAGLAAAVTAARSGARVVLVDAGPRLGGQFYRRPPSTEPAPGRVPAPTPPWPAFDRLEAQLPGLVAAGRLTVLTDTTVWAAERAPGEFRLRTRGDDRDPAAATGAVHARSVVIAAGAHDRQLPFPGWDLPGVISAGAAQALVKGSRVLPGRRVVVAGTGPFLLAAAATLVHGGGEVVAVVEAGAPQRLLGRPADLLPGLGRTTELAGYAALLARHRIPYLPGHQLLRASGEGEVSRVTVSRTDRDGRPRPGSDRELACDVLAVGFGFTAQLELAHHLGCPTRRSADGGLAVQVDRLQRTGVPGVLAAGETTGVAGAECALLEGLVAGAAATGRLGHTPAVTSRQLLRWQRRIAGLRRFADALHRTFAVPPGWARQLDDDTVVCRCEEVTAGAVRAAIAELGAEDPRTVKLLSRAGMGWCQGRICGFTVDRLCPPPTGDDAVTRQVAGAARPLAVPVGLAALAALAESGPVDSAIEEEPTP